MPFVSYGTRSAVNSSLVGFKLKYAYVAPASLSWFMLYTPLAIPTDVA